MFDPSLIKAVLFDLDDTLCDYMNAAVSSRRESFELIKERLNTHTIDDIEAAYLIVFAEMVKQSHPDGMWREDYLVEGARTRDETMHQMAVSLGINDRELAEAISDKYHQLRRSRIKLYEDTMPVLNTLKDRYHLGVITNGPADIQRDELSVLALDHFFENIYIEGEFGIGKPDPAIFVDALKKMDVKPFQTVFVGNSLESDVAGSKAAGITAVWINRNGAVLKENHIPPDFEITDLWQLLQILSIPDPRNSTC